eukprot:CAMPEP_0172391886 /NCGR_PEP_ID=MMETSP1061-20121228/8171_1 /TAXON_ID=37318 /ORGANISM="Pseudo-nitzschia pungens, Strain cf. pungens" /LENGTH=464 /DNA_ID=CAMNT_0013122611 /DNA_START=86 /DNA_END=1476 /DNA_ORIENTATION=+
MRKENRISFSTDGGAKHREPANKHTPVAIFEQQHILPKLKQRTEKGSLRRLKPIRRESSTASSHATIDFSTNDYLGLAQSIRQQQAVEDAYARLPLRGLGSTGSRLLTGDSDYAQSLEARLAKWHRRPAALLCNSGYDANLSVLSCLSLNSRVLMDELCHNSIQMGLRLSRGYTLRTFRHSCLKDLERLLMELENEEKEKVPRSALPPNTKPAVIVVESVYSMDGDAAPLGQILDLALRHNACVVVDEAHGLGVLGDRGLGLIEQLGLEHHPSLLCSVHTFGKAAGCHGAVVCGSRHLKSFLLNYGRPIIYSTSLPLHSLVSIACSYESMTSRIGDALRTTVGDRVRLFRKLFAERILGTASSSSSSSSSSSLPLKIRLVASDSPIHALIVPGNMQCVEFCDRLYEKSNRSIRLYPIRSPTVPRGQERVRIILHSHNTEAQVIDLMELIRSTLCDIGILANTPA